MKVKIKDLLNDEYKEECERDRYIYPENHMDGFVKEESQGTEHFTLILLVVIRYNGELYGFNDWENSEGERGINEGLDINEEIELFLVEEYTEVCYRVIENDEEDED